TPRARAPCQMVDDLGEADPTARGRSRRTISRAAPFAFLLSPEPRGPKVRFGRQLQAREAARAEEGGRRKGGKASARKKSSSEDANARSSGPLRRRISSRSWGGQASGLRFLSG